MDWLVYIVVSVLVWASFFGKDMFQAFCDSKTKVAEEQRKAAEANARAAEAVARAEELKAEAKAIDARAAG